LALKQRLALYFLIDLQTSGALKSFPLVGNSDDDVPFGQLFARHFDVAYVITVLLLLLFSLAHLSRIQ
jgi:hypothetical protein